jgi:hypothetical protein
VPIFCLLPKSQTLIRWPIHEDEIDSTTLDSSDRSITALLDIRLTASTGEMGSVKLIQRIPTITAQGIIHPDHRLREASSSPCDAIVSLRLPRSYADDFTDRDAVRQHWRAPRLLPPNSKHVNIVFYLFKILNQNAPHGAKKWFFPEQTQQPLLPPAHQALSSTPQPSPPGSRVERK